MNHDYFYLIERVGSKGKYQRNILIIFSSLWFITYFAVFGPYFLFLVTPFICPQISNQQECQKSICKLPQSQWKQYLPKSRSVYSLADQLGEYHCQYQQELAIYKSMAFIGVLFGYLTFTYISDNYGRRIGLLSGWATATVGILWVCFSFSFQAVSIGLFLAGAGSQACVRISFSVMNEVVDYYVRQKYNMVMQTFFGVGGVIIVVAYYWLRYWRVVMVLFCAVPSVIILLALYFYFEEIPRYLMAKGAIPLQNSLNKICHQNKTTEIPLKQLEQLSKSHNQSPHHPKHSYYHLLKYPSLRKITLPLIFAAFTSFSLYNGPYNLLGKFSLGIFGTQLVLSGADVLAYPIMAIFVELVPRRMGCMVLYVVIGGIYFVAYFASGSVVVTMLCLFSAKFFLCFTVGIKYLHIGELYPTVIRTNAYGGISTAGSLGSIWVINFIGIIQKHIDPLVCFGIFGIVACSIYSLLPETLQMPLKGEIQEQTDGVMVEVPSGEDMTEEYQF